MTMVMAVPAMPMMRMSDRNDNLSARCRNQRNEEQKGEKTECNLLHSTIGCRPLHSGCELKGSNFRRVCKT
jgi:hypothetical protein